MNIYPGAGRFLYTSQYSTAPFRTDVFQGNVSHIHRLVLGILQYISQFMVNTCSSLAVSLEGADARKKTRLRKTSGDKGPAMNGEKQKKCACCKES